MIRAGKVLTRTGCTAGVIPLDPGNDVVVFAAVATLAADFVHIPR